MKNIQDLRALTIARGDADLRKQKAGRHSNARNRAKNLSKENNS